MVGPGGQMGINPNMQSPNLMNGGMPFNGDGRSNKRGDIGHAIDRVHST